MAAATAKKGTGRKAGAKKAAAKKGTTARKAAAPKGTDLKARADATRPKNTLNEEQMKVVEMATSLGFDVEPERMDEATVEALNDDAQKVIDSLKRAGYKPSEI